MNSSKKSTPKKIERFELRLRPNLAAEAALLDSLEANEGVYGEKTKLLRECVRRGYLALLETRSKLPRDTSEDDVLKAFAAEYSTSGYSYRFGKLFLDAIGAVNNPVPANSKPDQTAAAEIPVATPDQAPATLQASASSEAGASVPQAVASSTDAVPPSGVVVPQEETSVAPVASEAAAAEGPNDEAVSEPEPPARPRVNWATRLGGIAGSGETGTKKN